MAKTTRQIIKIDEEKCDGCGLCVDACHEGALQLIGGKARLVREDYCDGLGDCIGECPRGAISFETREVEAFADLTPAFSCPACPSVQPRAVETPAEGPDVRGPAQPSALRNWPTQLKLAPPQAGYYHDADLLLCADCVPFAYPDFHRDLLAGKVVLQACPKLDDAEFYVGKLATIFAANEIRSITLTRMEVPCCGGLQAIVGRALAQAGKDIPVEVLTIGIEGEILDRRATAGPEPRAVMEGATRPNSNTNDRGTG